MQHKNLSLVSQIPGEHFHLWTSLVHPHEYTEFLDKLPELIKWWENEVQWESHFVTKALRYNEGKPQWTLVDFKSLEPLVRVLEFWARKYTRNNWKGEMPRDKLLDSLIRHVIALQGGEENDKESGLPHIGHILANAMFYSYHHAKLCEEHAPHQH